MASQGPNKILTAWLQQYCSGFAENDEDVLEMGGTPEMATLREALKLVGSVSSNPAWVEAHDAGGDLEVAMRALLRLTRIRRHNSV